MSFLIALRENKLRPYDGSNENDPIGSYTSMLVPS